MKDGKLMGTVQPAIRTSMNARKEDLNAHNILMYHALICQALSDVAIAHQVCS